MFDGNRREIAVHPVLHARVIARLDPPHDPPHDARCGDFGFEAAGFSVIFPLDWVEREPSDCERAAMRADDGAAVAKNAGGNVLGDGKEDGIAGVARGAHPRLRQRRCDAARNGTFLHERSSVSARQGPQGGTCHTCST